jgi:multisubunit Na+/H+ antiporter MnhF subunit
MVDMIDTWLFAAFCLLLLMVGVLFRMLRTKTRHDRYIAAMVAVMVGSAAGLTLSIGKGTLLVLDVTIVLALLCFAGIIAGAKFSGGAGA